MVGVLSAAGIMGGLALVLANLAKEQMGTQKRIETEAEITAVSQRIVRTLYDGDACRHTLSTHSNPASLPVISDGTTLTLGSIRSGKDKVVFESGNTYGNGLVKIHSLKLLSPAVTGDSAEAKLEVVMEKVSRAIKGYDKKKKEYPLTLNLGTGNRLSGCISDVRTVSSVVSEKVCTDIGGTWDAAATSCSLPSSLSNALCPEFYYLRGFDSGGNQVCHAPLNNAICGGTQYLQGLDPSGFNICRYFPSCPNGKYLRGFKSDGSGDCRDLPTPASPANPVANVDCGNGKALKGFDSGGFPVCVNLPVASSSTSVADMSCSSGKVVTGFSGGVPVCAAPPSGTSRPRPSPSPYAGVYKQEWLR